MLFNTDQIQTSNPLSDVVYKCKISGTVIADPGTSQQTFFAYQRSTGELLGSAVWNPETKQYLLYLPTITDEDIMLTRKDDAGIYFAETYDRLSQCVETFVHGQEYNDVQSNAAVLTLHAYKSSIVSAPHQILHEDLNVQGTLSFTDTFASSQLATDGITLLPKKIRGPVYSNYDILNYNGDRSASLLTGAHDPALNIDPFSDGSLIACYPLSTNGIDCKGALNVSDVHDDRFLFNGYYCSDALPRKHDLTIPVVFNRQSTKTLVFTLSLQSQNNNITTRLVTMHNLLALNMYSTRLDLYNMSGYLYAGPTSYTPSLFQKEHQIAIVASSSGNDLVYIDGVLRITREIATPTITNSQFVTLGGWQDEGATHRVTIKDVFVFNRALSAAELVTLQSVGRFPSKLPINAPVTAVKNDSVASLYGSVLRNTEKVYFPLKGNIGNTKMDKTLFSSFGGVELYADYVKFNGTTGFLWRGSIKGTVTADCNIIDESNIDFYLRFNPGALTAQCIWKSGDQTNGLAVGINASGILGLYARNAGVLTSCLFTNALTVSTWYKLTVVGNSISLYTDAGVLIETKAHGLTFTNYTGQESLGAAITGSPILGSSGDSGFFNGSVSDLIITTKNTLAYKSLNSENSISVWSGNTELPVEIVKWDVENNEAILWTQIPEVNVSSETKLAIKAKPATKSGLTGSAKAQMVWDDSFKAVYHMIPNTALVDSTRNHYDGVLTNIDNTNFVNDVSGYALQLNGTDEYAVINHKLLSNEQRTSLFMAFNNTAIASGKRVLDIALNNAQNSGQQLVLEYNGSSQLVASLYDTNAVSIGNVTSSALGTTEKHFTMLDYNGRSTVDSMRMFVDGVAADTDTASGERIASNAAKVYLGKDAYNSNYYNGSIAELFISEKQRSSDFEKIMRSSIKDELFTYKVIQDSQVQESSGVLCTIESGFTQNNVHNVPAMLRISESSGLSNLDISTLFNNARSDYMRYTGSNKLDHLFGFQRGGTSDFNMPALICDKGPRFEKKGSFKFTNNSIDITNNISKSYLLGEQLTVSLWVHPEAIPTSETLLFGTSTANEFQLTLDGPAYSLQLRTIIRHTSSGLGANTACSVGTWNHIVATRNTTLKRYAIYHNGVLSASGTFITNPAYSTNLVYIGGSQFTGKLADLKVYNTEFTSSDVLNLYNDSVDGFYKDTIVTSTFTIDPLTLKGDTLSSIISTDANSLWYALSFDNRQTFKIYKNNAWVNIVTTNPAIHGHTGETAPYYYDPETSDWVYMNEQINTVISKALQYSANRMNKGTLNTIADFSSVFNAATGNIDIAASFYSDGTVNPTLSSIVINNRNYWISDPYDLKACCDTVTSAEVNAIVIGPNSAINYWPSTKIYCMLDNGTSWVECVNGTIPNIPVGFNTTGRTARFRVVWDLNVWVTSASVEAVSLEVIIK